MSGTGVLDAAFYEYTPFCNGPDEVKSPSDRHAAELTLLSVVGAEAATLMLLEGAVEPI
jgi:hypothetical protein